LPSCTALVGLAAVFVGFNAHDRTGRGVFWRWTTTAQPLPAQDARDFAFAAARQEDPVEIAILRVELFLGVFIGAVTFTGSVIAYGKLAGKVTSVSATPAKSSCPAATC
jgi:NAD(P) transhydrogenase subunit beta